MLSLYKFRDYKNVIRAQIRNQPRPKGYKSTLAKVAGIHASYLTHVLSSKAHLTPDQASLLADFWTFSPVEFDYFLTLVHLGRASQRSYRKKMVAKLSQLKSSLLNQRESFKTQEDTQRGIHYYANWMCSAIHMLLLVPHLRSSKELADYLRMPAQEVDQQLQTLAELGLAVQVDKKWLPTQKVIHSTMQSTFAPLHHQNWRLRTIESIKSRRPGLNYTSVYCLGEREFAAIREKLQATIAEIDEMALKSAEETGAVLVLDWFKI